MLVHTVFFWLRPDLTPEQCAAFPGELKRLAAIASVRQGHVGVPAATGKRPVIDASYDFGLVTIFDGLAGHDDYQADPVHLDFLARCKTWWTRVQIYDTEV